jgi:hypothetical protein
MLMPTIKLTRHSRSIRRYHLGLLMAPLVSLGSCTGVPKVNVNAEGPLLTSEQGASFEITVTLARKPRGTVQVFAVSSDETEGSVSRSVQFQEDNWNQPQTLTVSGVDDELDDGDTAYEVMLYASTSSRPDAEPLLLRTFALVNRDDESARFDRLGDLPGGQALSQVTDLSAAGDVVVGFSEGESGEQAVRWTLDSGLRGLGGPASRAQAVSPDGTLIAGSVAEPSHEGGRAAALWRGERPYEILLGARVPPSGPALMWVVDGKAVLDDGTVFGTCIQVGAYGEPLACRYAGPDSVRTMALGHVFAADASGNFAGTRNAERHAPFHSFAMYNGAELPYPDGRTCTANMGCQAEARDFSDGGSVIVGTSCVPAVGTGTSGIPPLFDTAFVYTQAQGSLHLPDLADGEESSGAFAVSRNGGVIGGFGTDDDGQQAVIWTDGLPVRLEDLLLDAGGELPDGWRLSEVRAMSADGRTFAGNGTNPEGAPEGFRVALPSAP